MLLIGLFDVLVYKWNMALIIDKLEDVVEMLYSIKIHTPKTIPVNGTVPEILKIEMIYGFLTFCIFSIRPNRKKVILLIP